MTTLHLVSHTHWDREWYLTFQQFRLRLVDLVDGVLDLLESDPDFRHFNLDAQTIVLEDYLAVRPEARARLERHVRAGRLTIGPWYQLNDEFLTSGEATVRSLLLGSRLARSFGGCLRVGYLPDQFGNLSQMPQILRGFGIDNAIVGRGRQLVGDRRMEFWWEAPNGSRVLASLMAFWYNNAQYLPSAIGPAVEFLRGIHDRMAPKAATRHLLLMNGVDHLAAQPEAGRIARAANEAFGAAGEGIRVEHSTLQHYVDALRAQVTAEAIPLEVVRGELREDRGGSCLAGTLSTRMYLKQRNTASQSALEQYAERLSAFAALGGAPYPGDALRYAWKLLMQNHPHDSICGCSVDQVHREMLPRFDQVDQVAEELTERALDALTGRDRTAGAVADSYRIVVFNTLNWSRTDPVTVTVEFPLGDPRRGNPPQDDSAAPCGFLLRDPWGNEVPFALTRVETVVRSVLNPRELPLDQWVRRYTLELVAHDVPACGYLCYTLVPVRDFPRYAAAAAGAPDEVVLALRDGGDVGDEYLYRPPLRDEVLILEECPGLPLRREVNAVRQTDTVLDQEWLLPASATADHQARCEAPVACRVRLLRTRWEGVARTELTVEVENNASDHRLRLAFSTDLGEGVTESVAESAYDAVRRPVEHPLEAEGALPFHPQLSWVAVSGHGAAPVTGDGVAELEGAQTLAVFNRGLPEYQLTVDRGAGEGLAETRLEVTLLRCVAQLSGRGDGPGIATPAAQCPGHHRFELAYLVEEGDWEEARVWRQAHQFAVPLRAVQSPPAAGIAGERSYLSLEPETLVVTAIKGAEDRPSLVLRCFNISEAESAQGLLQVPGATRMRRVRLDECPIGPWSEGEELRIQAAPKEIVTVEIEM